MTRPRSSRLSRGTRTRTPNRQNRRVLSLAFGGVRSAVREAVFRKPSPARVRAHAASAATRSGFFSRRAAYPTARSASSARVSSEKFSQLCSDPTISDSATRCFLLSTISSSYDVMARSNKSPAACSAPAASASRALSRHRRSARSWHAACSSIDTSWYRNCRIFSSSSEGSFLLFLFLNVQRGLGDDGAPEAQRLERQRRRGRRSRLAPPVANCGQPSVRICELRRAVVAAQPVHEPRHQQLRFFEILIVLLPAVAHQRRDEAEQRLHPPRVVSPRFRL